MWVSFGSGSLSPLSQEMMGGRNRAVTFTEVPGKGFCRMEATHPKPALLRLFESFRKSIYRAESGNSSPWQLNAKHVAHEGLETFLGACDRGPALCGARLTASRELPELPPGKAPFPRPARDRQHGAETRGAGCPCSPPRPGGSQGLSVSTWEKIKVQLWEVSSALGKRPEGRDEAAAADKASERFPTLGGSRAVGGPGRGICSEGSGVCVGVRSGAGLCSLWQRFSPSICFCVCVQPVPPCVAERSAGGLSREQPWEGSGHAGREEEEGGIADGEKAAERCFLPGLASHGPCCGRRLLEGAVNATKPFAMSLVTAVQ